MLKHRESVCAVMCNLGRTSECVCSDKFVQSLIERERALGKLIGHKVVRHLTQCLLCTGQSTRSVCHNDRSILYVVDTVSMAILRSELYHTDLMSEQNKDRSCYGKLLDRCLLAACEAHGCTWLD